MAQKIELTGKQILGLLLLGVVAVAILMPTQFEQWTGIKLFEKTSQPNQATTPPEEEEEKAVLPPVTRACLKHEYTLGTSANPVRIYVVDKLNPKAGIPGVEMEVLNVPTPPYTLDKIIAIASNPMRSVVDEDTSTDSNGAAEFSSNTILVYMDYIFSLRGDSTIYDKVKVMKVPCVPPEREGYTFPDKFEAYYVGNFTDLYTSDTITENITGKSGLQYLTFDITIGLSDTSSGRAVKDPVIVLRSPEGYELEPGDIVSIYIVRKEGSDLGIPGINLIDYLAGETPIPLKGSIYDEDYQAYMMTIADSATYTVKITYDADQIQPTTDKLQIVVDDLGDYRAKDDVTKDTKAPAETLTIQFTT